METINLNQSGIYAIVSPSGKRYVGSAVCFRKRWAIHRHQLCKGKHHCHALQRAYLKYGGALEYTVLEICPKGDLILREQFYIDSTEKSALYNSSHTAGSSLGVVRSEETRGKLRNAKLGTQASAETRSKMCAAQGRVLRKSNNSGYVGVGFDKKLGSWRARKDIIGKTVHLGLYPTAELANQARQNFDRILDYYSHS